ncbi:MAG: hypothetical protein A2663_00170 [Candidatus Buchananbacteria bacterium RIFCSPHIGHO2_01_FULL_46_12]|uniref:Clp R domain-containing protein n=1 Tax=Candidatus Buchananbacteria bacterium RIFCSPHIGHO2_01_FULL_46_12 TaxID=1797536 RepID=A0A1G1Y6N9_9BACT|nr:MAG: hypothetical protein A2663_00170 [Candidatus Buchananbacteria bacterium RIFCSPHIGHO2_01_FULL_46_12]
MTPEHILYGLSLEKGSLAEQILSRIKISGPEIKKIMAENPPARQTIAQIGLTADVKKILQKAFLIASSNQHQYVGTEHLLASILALNDGVLADFFKQKGVNLPELQKQINIVLNSTSKFSELTGLSDDFGPDNLNQNYGPGPALTKANQSILEVFGVNLTDAAIQQNIDPVIGREEEIDRLIQILCRRHKNNPLLLGEPGVGKTAIVEGLAKKIVSGDVPDVLIGKSIYTIDLSAVLAGTSFRGEFENRLKQILNEVKKNPSLILFIDEIHNLIGAGSAGGALDAANILKPALARGEVRCLGATTPEAYKKYIESDPALERRFQPVNVFAPSVEKTEEILLGIKENYEIFHQVQISREAIQAAAKLSERYLADRFLPDKAIDLIDEAASAVKIKTGFSPELKEINNLENQLKEIQRQKQQSVREEKFAAALKWRRREQEIISQLKNLKESRLKEKQKNLPVITAEEISQVVSKITGIPLSNLILEEKAKLLGLSDRLEEKIFGQTPALEAIAESIRRSRAGIASARRPIGSFIFLGPSGVGKTELAKVLAETIFGSAEALIRIDMSEFAESFNISKLIGAPAGYVGYKEGAKLTDAVRRRPYCVVLFDEIEKAHPQIFNLLLQVLEDGNLTDATGRQVNFRNTVIIMTSNLGSESFNRQAGFGFEDKNQVATGHDLSLLSQIGEDVVKKLKDKFPPEFLSRIDKTIVFQPLDDKTIEKIVWLQLEELKDRLEKQDLKITFDPAVAKYLAKISFKPETGARLVRKNIQELAEGKIANKILSAEEPAKKLLIKIKNNEITIE